MVEGHARGDEAAGGLASVATTCGAVGNGALTGIVVLEVGNFMAAPFATLQLADQGAGVIKVEDPRTGDLVRATGPFVEGHSSPFARLNRGKRSVALDLKSPAGRDAFLRLVDGADVLVENLRPGALRRLGLDYDTLSQRNPRLVYASASGWGQDGPLAPLPGLDIMAQARSGLMSITGHPGNDPVKVGVPICDLVCGLYVVQGVLAALLERAHSGRGQYIDVSLLESGVSFAVWEAGKWFATGEVPAPQGSAHQSTAPYQALRTRDGHVTVGAVTPPTWTAFCEALGLSELADDPRYASSSERHAHRDQLIPVLEERTGQMTTSEVVTLLDRTGVPVAPIATYDQVFTDEHLNARDFYWDAPHPHMGAVRQVGSPVRLSRTPAQRGAAGPLHGEHTREILLAAGLEEAQIDHLLATGAAAIPEQPSG
jgi:crotonobetainyl-CoA:carnitine CoA-transferase CaiB-like acyl-CoA transferase